MCFACAALIKDRARRSKLQTYDVADDGARFLGSSSFPPDCVASCILNDPKALFFREGDVSTVATAEQQEAWKAMLDGKGMKGKRLLVCSGADDRLVPFAHSRPFVEWLEDASRTWYKEGGMYLESKVYSGVGHALGLGMVQDALRFVVDSLVVKVEAEGKGKS